MEDAVKTAVSSGDFVRLNTCSRNRTDIVEILSVAGKRPHYLPITLERLLLDTAASTATPFSVARRSATMAFVMVKGNFEPPRFSGELLTPLERECTAA